MKTFLLILMIASGISNCSSSKNRSQPSVVADGQTKNNGNGQDLPACVRKMIVQYQAEEKQNPPRQLYSYTYKSKTVYYLTAPCCDFFSDLYDSSCVLIGHPDGGFTGRGDGSITDFNEKRKDEKLIWKDDRK